ncbi:hypothetical protein TUBRATIS_009860 [Tubulinosema ratisbonensis]|uniref:Uncharacterized protein n=1 Tax=Tubulinosema ratisbonensis TaxID=291195 RepID=A0A437AND7_9MICR|nr:hypothetical protein TUBRATIS_009860 [Tubulinosema ratisbonensis]
MKITAKPTLQTTKNSKNHGLSFLLEKLLITFYFLESMVLLFIVLFLFNKYLNNNALIKEVVFIPMAYALFFSGLYSETEERGRFAELINSARRAYFLLFISLIVMITFLFLGYSEFFFVKTITEIFLTKSLSLDLEILFYTILINLKPIFILYLAYKLVSRLKIRNKKSQLDIAERSVNCLSIIFIFSLIFLFYHHKTFYDDQLILKIAIYWWFSDIFPNVYTKRYMKMDKWKMIVYIYKIFKILSLIVYLDFILLDTILKNNSVTQRIY